MDQTFEPARRRLLGHLGAALAAGTVAGIVPAAAQGVSPGASPEPRASFGPLKRVRAGDLEVAYAEAGPADGKPVLLLHGWPYDIHSYVDVAPVLAQAGYRVLIPSLRGYGATRFLSEATPRNGQQAALAHDALALLDALSIERVLVAGYDWGARTACILAALWPARCKGLVSVSGYLIGSQQANAMPLPPKAELQWWYQFYFATERGREGYARYTREFVRLIWELASPQWRFDDATFARSAPAFDNPDHVAVSIHNYRWRLGLAQGEARFDETERRLAAFPVIAVPTITLEGDANGAPHPDPAAYAKKFSGPYAHRTITGGVGHNLPQEAPQAFAQAVVDVDGF
ncbi:alpha/beta hydrolase (plasmid) [Methylobacterium currus]|uniref:alpha/beta fold hydrolase n=1 Tax=Methylobacterium currus TaxID=2051553 RepID=UPI001E5323C1|nr:alpha/beta hydrolase [Methylobacterium currus]UHC20166.1 alpha/beta hydrolase [Methylobacterium currus]